MNSKTVLLSLLLLSFLSVGHTAHAQKRVDFSVYAGSGLLKYTGDGHDVMTDDGFSFKAEPVYELGGEVKIALSSNTNTIFIKPALEANRTKFKYSKSSSKTTEMTSSYMDGRKLVKYETTQYKSSYEKRTCEAYNILMPVTFGYQFSLDSENMYKMALGALGFVGLPAHSKNTVERGWSVVYHPFYENGGKKIFHKQTEGDSTVEATNPETKLRYGFGGQATFYVWKFNLQYSFRYEKVADKDNNMYGNYHLLTIGYSF